MSWIKSYQGLKSHPKTLKFARMIGGDKQQAIGLLHCFWWWAMEHAEDGDLTGLDNQDFEDGVGFTEWSALLALDQTRDWNHPKDSLKDILKECALVDKDNFIHNWPKYAKDYLRSKYHNSDPQKYQAILDKWYKGGKDSPKDNPKDNPKDVQDKIRLDKIRLDDIKETSIPAKEKRRYLDFVFLADDEYGKLRERFKDDLNGRIEELNAYIGSKGNKYRSHYHTLISWSHLDKKRGKNAVHKQPDTQIDRISGKYDKIESEA